MGNRPTSDYPVFEDSREGWAKALETIQAGSGVAIRYTKREDNNVTNMKERFMIAVFGSPEVRVSADIKPAPLQIKTQGLRKARSRQILQALDNGVYEKGNHKIQRVFISDTQLLRFYYRGTPIATFDLITGEYREPFIGEFEDTIATKNQRKVVKEAVQEVFGLVL